jgi:hypothetical protein
MDYMVSLHFYRFYRSWGVLYNGPLYCITLCHGASFQNRAYTETEAFCFGIHEKTPFLPVFYELAVIVVSKLAGYLNSDSFPDEPSKSGLNIAIDSFNMAKIMMAKRLGVHLLTDYLHS